jgi:hypothetical protein
MKTKKTIANLREEVELLREAFFDARSREDDAKKALDEWRDNSISTSQITFDGVWRIGTILKCNTTLYVVQRKGRTWLHRHPFIDVIKLDYDSYKETNTKLIRIYKTDFPECMKQLHL